MCVLFATIAVARSAGALTSVFATFNSIGVTVDIGGSDDTAQIGSASLQYRETGSQTWLNAHPLVRTTVTRYVGSIMWLKQDTSYEVKVRVSTDSADLGPQTIKTRAESETELPTATKSYYASPSGSGSTCSDQSPCALAFALDAVSAGEEVVLKDGVYHVGEISLSNSASKYVVIRGSRQAILDGSDPATFTWTNQGGTVYKTTITKQSPNVVLANGKRLFKHTSLTDLQSLAEESPGFFTTGTDLYVNLQGMGETNPANANVKISRYEYAFVSDSYFFYHGFTMRYYGIGDYGKGIYLDTASNNVISNMYFDHNDASVALKRPSYNNVIQDCEFFDSKFDFLWESVKGGSPYETAPVTVYETVDQSGRGLVIRRNRFEGFFDSIQPVGGFAEDHLPVELDLHDNVITKSADDAISLDGTCANCRVWGNKIDNCLVAFSMAPIDEGPTFVTRNLAYNLQGSRSDAGYKGLALKLNSGYDEKGKMLVYHNTFDVRVAGTVGLSIMSPGVWNLLTLRNNIFWAADDTYAIYNVNAQNPVDMDYDLFYTTKSDFIAFWDDTKHATLALFAAETSQEVNGYFAMPVFNDRNGGDYRLTSASTPQIDKGVVIDGFNDGYRGSAPDLGYFEYDDGTPLAPLSSAPTSNSPSSSSPNGGSNNPSRSPSGSIASIASSSMTWQVLSHAIAYLILMF